MMGMTTKKPHKEFVFCFVCCSFGQFGLREDVCVVQRSSLGQSDRLGAEPGQRRGTEGCSQVLSGGTTNTLRDVPIGF